MAGADTTEKNLAEHHDLHSERGALSGEHAGRAADPTIKVSGLAWLEFEKRDLDRAEQFARDFGLTVHARTDAALYLRGSRAGAPAVVIRQGRASRYLGAAFHALDGKDLDRLARATGAGVEARRELGSGRVVRLSDPSGFGVQVVHGVEELPALPAAHTPLTWNVGGRAARVNATQRPPREPAGVERLGHVVLGTRVFGRALDWYLQNLGLIVSDFLYLDGQRGRGPVMAFIRCDRGSLRATTTRSRCCWHPRRGTSTPPTRSPTSTRSRPAGSTSGSADTTAPGGSAGTSRAARSSTTGATRTA